MIIKSEKLKNIFDRLNEYEGCSDEKLLQILLNNYIQKFHSESRFGQSLICSLDNLDD